MWRPSQGMLGAILRPRGHACILKMGSVQLDAGQSIGCEASFCGECRYWGCAKSRGAPCISLCAHVWITAGGARQASSGPSCCVYYTIARCVAHSPARCSSELLWRSEVQVTSQPMACSAAIQVTAQTSLATYRVFPYAKCM